MSSAGTTILCPVQLHSSLNKERMAVSHLNAIRLPDVSPKPIGKEVSHVPKTHYPSRTGGTLEVVPASHSPEWMIKGLDDPDAFLKYAQSSITLRTKTLELELEKMQVMKDLIAVLPGPLP